jgi:hypothetical protein
MTAGTERNVLTTDVPNLNSSFGCTSEILYEVSNLDRLLAHGHVSLKRNLDPARLLLFVASFAQTTLESHIHSWRQNGRYSTPAEPTRVGPEKTSMRGMQTAEGLTKLRPVSCHHEVHVH